MRNKYLTGYSLLELMTVLLIISILAALAYPSYSKNKALADRKYAEVILLNISIKLAEYYAKYGTYVGFKDASLGGGFNKKVPYQFKANNISDELYSISAVPDSRQKNLDAGCGTLSLDDKSVKSSSGIDKDSNCWF